MKTVIVVYYFSICAGMISLCSKVTLTSFKNFLNFDMIGAEATVELEMVSIIQEGSTQ